MRLSRGRWSAGFTLVEMATSMGAGCLVLAGVIISGVALQRSFTAVEGYSVAEGDQLRIQDYIAMDCRRAVDVEMGSWSGTTWTANASGGTLRFAVPNYYDVGGNPQGPTYNAGTLQYGTGEVTYISYYKSGGSFIRQVGTSSTICTPGTVWTSCAKAIATNVADFTVQDLDASALSGTVKCRITFSPRFTMMAGPGPVTGTTVYAETFLRNAKARSTSAMASPTPDP